LKQRIITGVLFGLVVLVLLFTNDWTRLILLCLIPLLSGTEYLSITKSRPVQYILFISVSILVYYFGSQANVDLVLITIFCLLNSVLIINLFLDNPIITHKNWSGLIGGIYIAGPFIFALSKHTYTNNKEMLISALLLIWVTDSSAYFVGSQIGKKKLFKKISPKKTWEGFFGAGMCTLIFSYILGSIWNIYDLKFWVLFGLIVWILGALGDLVASHVKRLNNAKDSGTLLPGHGGFYDRFDALIFILPFLLLLLYFNQGL